MKTNRLLIILGLLITIFGCRKNSGGKEPEDSLMLLDTLISNQRLQNGNIETERYSFEYNDDWQVTEIFKEIGNVPAARFTYASGTLNSITIYGPNGGVYRTHTSPETLQVYDDSTFYYYTFPNFQSPVPDTFKVTLHHADTVISRIDYVHISQSMTERSENSYEMRYRDRNLYESGYVFNGNFQPDFGVYSLDDKINPLRYLSPVVYEYLHYELGFSMGINNVTGIIISGSNELLEYEYTYNEDGLPLTMREKGQNYNLYEFRYRKQG